MQDTLNGSSAACQEIKDTFAVRDRVLALQEDASRRLAALDTDFTVTFVRDAIRAPSLDSDKVFERFKTFQAANKAWTEKRDAFDAISQKLDERLKDLEEKSPAEFAAVLRDKQGELAKHMAEEQKRQESVAAQLRKLDEMKKSLGGADPQSQQARKRNADLGPTS